jgi:hypothetical protein
MGWTPKGKIELSVTSAPAPFAAHPVAKQAADVSEPQSMDATAQRGGRASMRQ